MFASSRSAFVIATVLLVACVIGGIGFVLGRDSADPAEAQSTVRAASAKRVAAVRKTAYDRGFEAGKRAAERQAARDREADRKPSGHDALAVDEFDLQDGYYVVQVSDRQARDYAPMQAGVSYELCSAYGVCRRAP